MLNFQKLSLSDMPLLRKLMVENPTRICDQTPGCVMQWRRFFETEYAVENGILFFTTRYLDGKRYFCVPIGDFFEGMRLLEESAHASGEPFWLIGVSREDSEKLAALYPNSESEAMRDWFDYLYEAERMKTYSGKKLSGERNHKNRFVAAHPNWRLEEITLDNLPAVRAFFEEHAKSYPKNSPLARAETESVREILDHYEEYGFSGGMITENGKVFGFALGEIMGDTLYIHVEKARREENGAYQTIDSEFIRRFAHHGVKYVNREDDSGDEGLRKSKLAYHPVALLEKFRVIPKH